MKGKANMNKLYIITGPAGVGKSTISYEVGKRLKKSVVIEGDTIYNFFVGGRIKPWYKNAPLDLFWNNCIMLIKSYLETGYDVVFNYIISNKNLDRLKETFKDYEIIFRCLLVDEKTIIDQFEEVGDTTKSYTKKKVVGLSCEEVYEVEDEIVKKKNNIYKCYGKRRNRTKTRKEIR